MKEEPRSCSCRAIDIQKFDKYLKRPESLVFETDEEFLGNISLMKELSLKFKRDEHLKYLPRELKNNESFMLDLIKERPGAYNFAGQKLSKSSEFAVLAMRANPETVDSVFFKHENFFNNIQVINEAMKYEQSDFYEIPQDIDEYIHKKNICSKEDLLEMFGEKRRCDYLVKCYEDQVINFMDDWDFIDKVTRYNEFSFVEKQENVKVDLLKMNLKM